MGYGTGLFRVKARGGVSALSAVGFKNQSAFHHHHVLAVLYNVSYKYFNLNLGQVSPTVPSPGFSSRSSILEGLLKDKSWLHCPPPPALPTDFLIHKVLVRARDCISSKFPGPHWKNHCSGEK